MSGILSYFDLNKRVETNYVEIPANPSRGFAGGTGKAVPVVPVWRQGLLYVSTVVGVLFSSAIMDFQAGKLLALHITIVTIVLSAIIGVMIMPNIYEKTIKQDSPLIVQIGLFVQQGVFWSVVLTALGKVFG